MADMTDFLEQNLRDHFKSDTQLTLEDTYISLHTADPTDTGSTANEVSGGAYSRQVVNQDGTTSPYWVNTTAAGTGIDNNSTISFPTATASWGTVSHIGVMDQSTTGGGNMLFHGSLNTNKQVTTNDKFELASNDLSITFD